MRLRLRQVEQEDDEMIITSMVDILILLLMFFMLTSSFSEEVDVFKVVSGSIYRHRIEQQKIISEVYKT